MVPHITGPSPGKGTGDRPLACSAPPAWPGTQGPISFQDWAWGASHSPLLQLHRRAGVRAQPLREGSPTGTFQPLPEMGAAEAQGSPAGQRQKTPNHTDPCLCPRVLPVPKGACPLPSPGSLQAGRHQAARPGQPCPERGFGKGGGCGREPRASSLEAPGCAGKVTVLSVSQIQNLRPREAQRPDGRSQTSGSPPTPGGVCRRRSLATDPARPGARLGQTTPVWVSEKGTSGRRPRGAESAWHLGGGRALRPGAPR